MDDDRQVVLLGESEIWNVAGVFRSEMQVTEVRLERDNLHVGPIAEMESVSISRTAAL
jgi:hypothetical protein